MLLREQVVSSPPAAGKYRTAPLRTHGYPPGIRHIIVNECAERFSFYGMKYLLLLYLTKYHLFSDTAGLGVLGSYASLVYAMPVLGGLIAASSLAVGAGLMIAAKAAKR